jgi:hypothetical protein
MLRPGLSSFRSSELPRRAERSGGAPKKGMKRTIAECALLLVAVTVWAEARVRTQLPTLLNKESRHRGRGEGKYFVEH